MARMSKERLAEWHDYAKKAINKTVCDEGIRELRDKIIETNRFVRVVGAQWEGQTFNGTDLRERMDKYPRFEINKLLKEIRRISAEMRKNRINIDFKPAKPDVDQAISDKLNGRYRADYVESDGDYAITNAYEDAITGGFGAFRLCAEYEDELDAENDNLNIKFKAVYDAASCVFFDPSSREMDKSDAMWACEIFGIPAEEFRDEYGRDGYSINIINSGRWEDRYPPNVVYVARFYQVKIERDELVVYENPFIQEQVTYFESELDDDTLAELQVGEAYFEKSRRKVKRRRVYCGTMDGDGWLDKPELLPFEYLPIIPVYGQRWFVDGQERVQGHATPALDVQRLENLMVSMLADAATLGTEGTPIVPVEMMNDQFMKVWADRNKKRPAFLPITALRDKEGNPVAYGNAIAYTQPAQLNQGMVGLLQYTGTTIQELTGGMNQEAMPSNLATDTVNALINRGDSHTGVYMDNLRFAMKHAGRVWLSAAKNAYSERELAMLDEEGSERFDTVPEFSDAQFKVVVDVGADFTTRRDQTVSKLTPIFMATSPENPNHNVILSTIIDNLEGEGVDDLRKYNRKQLLLQGVVEPRNEQEQAMLAEQQQAAQNQQPDANTLLAQAEMEKARVQEAKAQMDYQVEVARLQIEAARLELEAAKVGAEINLKQVQSMKIETEAMKNVREASNPASV